MGEMTEAQRIAIDEMLKKQRERDEASRKEMAAQRGPQKTVKSQTVQIDERQSRAEAERYGKGGKFGTGEVDRTTASSGSKSMANNNER